MTVKSFEAALQNIHDIRMHARELNRIANYLEMDLFESLGIRQVEREPGWPNWEIDGAPGYFNTPRDAFMYKETRR